MAGLQRRAATCVADRRDRQGRHRIPQRSAAGAGSDGVRRLRDRRASQARQRPVVIITSNNEKELPDAFLRRCFFHYIRFPDKAEMQAIVKLHYPRPQGEPACRGNGSLLRAARGRGAAQEALHLRAAGLDPPALGRRYRPRGDARPRARQAGVLRYMAPCSRPSRICISSRSSPFWPGAAADPC